MRSSLDTNDQTEPSVNMEAMTVNEPRWREESFQITPQHMPVTLDTRNATRPVTTKPRSNELMSGRAPVLVRSSNRRPIEAGEGAQSEVWSVSDPFAAHNSPHHSVSDRVGDGSGGAVPGMGDDPTAPPLGLSIGKLVLAGALLGAFAYYLKSR
jgi:hypothetical protein